MLARMHFGIVEICSGHLSSNICFQVWLIACRLHWSKAIVNTELLLITVNERSIRPCVVRCWCSTTLRLQWQQNADVILFVCVGFFIVVVGVHQDIAYKKNTPAVTILFIVVTTSWYIGRCWGLRRILRKEDLMTTLFRLYPFWSSALVFIAC